MTICSPRPSPIVPVLPSREYAGFPTKTGNPPEVMGMPLSQALEKQFQTDAHICQYRFIPELPYRLKKEAVTGREVSLEMFIVLVDHDYPRSHSSLGGERRQPAPLSWQEEQVGLLQSFEHGPPLSYATQGGLRHVWQLAQPRVLRDASDLDGWKTLYVRFLLQLARLDVICDPNTAPATSLFRAPRATRDGVLQDLPIWGDPNVLPSLDYYPCEEGLLADLELARRLKSATPKHWNKGSRVLERAAGLSKPRPSSRRRGGNPVPECRPVSEFEEELIEVIRGIEDGRHDLYLSLAGALLQLGTGPEHVPGSIYRIASGAGDDRADARQHDAETTVQKFLQAEREPLLGLGSLRRNWPQVAAVLDTFSGGGSGIADARKELDSRPVPARSETCEQAQQAISQLVRDRQGGVVVAPPGVGKTSAVLNAVATSTTSTILSFPTNRLAERAQESIAEERPVKRRQGLLAALDETGAPKCKRPEEVREIQRAGASAVEILCWSCVYRSKCTARRTETGSPGATVTIVNHQLRLSTPAEVDLRIIDEPPPLFFHRVLTHPDLVQAESALRFFDPDFVCASLPILRAAKNRLEHHASPTESSGAQPQDDSPFAVSRFLDACARGAQPLLKSTRDLSVENRKLVLQAITCLDALAGSHSSGRIAIADNYACQAHGLRPPALLLTWVDESVLSWVKNPSTLLLDATPDLVALERLVPGLPVHRFDVVEPVPTFRNMVYWSQGTRRSLMDHGPNWNVIKRGLTVALARVPTAVLVVSFKPVIDYLRTNQQESTSEVAKLLGKRRVALAHYGYLRGENTFENVDWSELDAVITLGDPYPNLSILGAENDILGLTEEEGMKRVHERTSAELGQAHGRLRSVRRTRPGVCVHVGRVVPAGWNGQNATLEAFPPGRLPSDTHMTVGQLEDLRDQLGIEALAAKAQVSRATLYRYLGGHPVPLVVANRLLEQKK